MTNYFYKILELNFISSIQNLNKFLKDQKESIDDVIDKQVSKKIDKNLEFEIQYETQKHQVIKEASDQLKLFL